MTEHTTQHEMQYIKMTQTPIKPLIVSLAIPTIISMLITSIYNMADTFFVSQLGRSSSGAVGIVFSLMAIIQAIGFTLGQGSGAQISRLLGQQRDKDASIIGSTGFFSALFFGTLLAILGLIFVNPLMQLLGATDTILPYATSYAKYILLVAPIMTASFVLNNLLRSEGKASFAMIGIGLGGVLNILLDPLFIFVFDLGISGAAIATAISQCISFFILLSCFLRKKTIVRLNIRLVSPHIMTYFRIITNGFPSFCRQGLASISTVALNINAAVYGDAAVAAMSIVGKIFMMLFSVSLGLGQGYQPVVGFNYGAKKYDRVKQAFFFTLFAGTVFMSVFAITVFFLAPTLMQWFIKGDETVSAIGVIALRAQCIAMPFISLGVACNMTFQSVGKPLLSTILSAARQGIFFLPLILILPQCIGLFGVQITQPLADVLTFLCCFPFVIHFFKGLNKLKKEQ